MPVITITLMRTRPANQVRLRLPAKIIPQPQPPPRRTLRLMSQINPTPPLGPHSHLPNMQRPHWPIMQQRRLQPIMPTHTPNTMHTL